MKTKIIVAILIITISSACMALKFWYYLPPRTPAKLARIIGGLRVPKEVKPIVFKEENTFTGEGYMYLVFEFDSLKTTEFITNNEFSEFEKLPINIKLPAIPDELYHYMPAAIYNKYYLPLKEDSMIEYSGNYKLDKKQNSKSFNFTLFDKKKKKLFIYSYHD